jgi:hypothetical protein
MRSRYSMISDWYIEGNLDEVATILADGPGYARLWSSVYLDVTTLEPGDEHQVGKVLDIHSKGWLPYTLRWQATVTGSRYPSGFSIRADGDVVGNGVRTLQQHGNQVHARFTWMSAQASRSCASSRSPSDLSLAPTTPGP